LADAANDHPDVDLRYAGVTVSLVSHDIDGLSERDVELAGRSLQSRTSSTWTPTRRPYRRFSKDLSDPSR